MCHPPSPLNGKRRKCKGCWIWGSTLSRAFLPNGTTKISSGRSKPINWTKSLTQVTYKQICIFINCPHYLSECSVLEDHFLLRLLYIVKNKIPVFTPVFSSVLWLYVSWKHLVTVLILLLHFYAFDMNKRDTEGKRCFGLNFRTQFGAAQYIDNTNTIQTLLTAF